MYFHNVAIISLWKEHGPSFNKTRISIIQEYFVPKLVEIGTVVLKKKTKMLKVYDKDGLQTNNNQKSSPEPSTQVS